MISQKYPKFFAYPWFEASGEHNVFSNLFHRVFGRGSILVECAPVIVQNSFANFIVDNLKNPKLNLIFPKIYWPDYHWNRPTQRTNRNGTWLGHSAQCCSEVVLTHHICLQLGWRRPELSIEHSTWPWHRLLWWKLSKNEKTFWTA